MSKTRRVRHTKLVRFEKIRKKRLEDWPLFTGDNTTKMRRRRFKRLNYKDTYIATIKMLKKSGVIR